VDMSEIVAVGDGANDIALLTCAGLGVAMGNAKAEVRNAAAMVPMMSRPMALPGCWKACLGAAGEGNYVAMSPRSSPGRPEELE